MSTDHRTTDLSRLLFADTYYVRFFLDAKGDPWWVAQDVCAILDIRNASKALLRLRDQEKAVTKSYTLGGEQSLLCINEQGLYRLLMRSNKAEAIAFQDWLVGVIKQIRVTGSYTTPRAQPALPPRQRPETRIEVSQQMARVWHLLRSSDDWMTNADIARHARVSISAVRTYTLHWLQLGLLERHESYPRHLHRLAADAERQYTRLWSHLETCTTILLQYAKDHQ